MTTWIDEARPVREGEMPDMEGLTAWFRSALPELDGPIELRQFPSGYSNLTYLARIGDRELVMRRPPVGSKVKAAHDMAREFRALQALHPVYPAAPRPLAYCEDNAVIGRPLLCHGAHRRRDPARQKAQDLYRGARTCPPVLPCAH